MRLNDTSSPEEADRYNHVADPQHGEEIRLYLGESELMHFHGADHH